MVALPHPAPAVTLIHRRMRELVPIALVLSLVACGQDAPPPPALETRPAPEGAPGAATPRAPDALAEEPPAEGAPAAPPEWSPPTLPTRSAGCGAVPSVLDGASLVTGSGRTFHVWAPPSYDPARAYPVVVVYHGWYSNGRDHQRWFEMEKYVDASAITVYPDADGPVWDIAGERDLAFFDAMIAGLGERYCIDPSRVLAFGFSYGGKFANHLGCKRAGYVKAIAVGAGSWGGDGRACGRLPVLVTHRTHDPDELIGWGRDVQSRWVRLDGCEDVHEPLGGAPGCTAHRRCQAPGSVTFCEAPHFDPSWPAAWNHTVRESHRAFTWQWFAALP